MARLLSDAGISAKIRRAGAAITERGCGYTLEIQRRHAARAMQACRAGRRAAESRRFCLRPMTACKRWLTMNPS